MKYFPAWVGKAWKSRANINTEGKLIFLGNNLSLIFISSYVLFGPASRLDVFVGITHSQLHQQMHLNVTQRSSCWNGRRSFRAANDVICEVYFGQWRKRKCSFRKSELRQTTRWAQDQSNGEIITITWQYRDHQQFCVQWAQGNRCCKTDIQFRNYGAPDRSKLTAICKVQVFVIATLCHWVIVTRNSNKAGIIGFSNPTKTLAPRQSVTSLKTRNFNKTSVETSNVPQINLTPYFPTDRRGDAATSPTSL